MNIDHRRVQIVLSLRSSGVTEVSVMAAMESLPREIFVPETLRQHAYEDTTLPIGYGQTLSQPSVVGIMTQALSVGNRAKVLEVGTGSGYQTVVLAKLARRVYTIERHRSLMKNAEMRFQELRISNVTTKCGDGTRGWSEQIPFDRILVTAAASDVPPILADQLTIGGIMVVPIGYGSDFHTILIVERTETGFDTDELRDVPFVPLVSDEADKRVLSQ